MRASLGIIDFNEFIQQGVTIMTGNKRSSLPNRYLLWISGLPAALTPIWLGADCMLRKIALCIIGIILALILIASGIVYLIWHNEIGALISFRMVRDRDEDHRDGAVYMMHVPGGFYLEDFIEQGGAKSDHELISFITSKITRGLIPMQITPTDVGCASFTAGTPEGDRLFGRNYDFKESNVCIVRTDGGNGRHATISTVDLQFLGIDRLRNVEGLMERITCLAAPYVPLDGINEAGVSCGIFMSYQGGRKSIATDQNTDRPDITSTTLLRLILDYADNVDEAVEIARKYDLHDSGSCSYHYMVADASGRSAILEWVNLDDPQDRDGSKRELIVIYNDADDALGPVEAESDFQCITNFILAPGYYENAAPTKPRFGAERYDKLYQDLGKTGGVVADENEAMRILLGIGRRTWNNDDGNGCTVHSAVYNLTDKTALWVSNENFDDETAVFHLGFDR